MLPCSFISFFFPIRSFKNSTEESRARTRTSGDRRRQHDACMQQRERIAVSLSPLPSPHCKGLMADTILQHPPVVTVYWLAGWLAFCCLSPFHLSFKKSNTHETFFFSVRYTVNSPEHVFQEFVTVHPLLRLRIERQRERDRERDKEARIERQKKASHAVGTPQLKPNIFCCHL